MRCIDSDHKERGTRMALSNLALFGGAFFTPVLVGKITHTIGWEWTFYFVAIFTGLLFPFVIFFVPETAYRREDSLNTDFNVGASTTQTHGNFEKYSSEHTVPSESSSKSPGELLRPQTADIIIPQKVSFARSLLPFNGRKTDESLIKLILRPLPLFFHPAIFWACLIQGAMIGWTVMIGIVLAAIFLGPPLWFNEVKTGYMYTGPFVGAILGFVVAGLLSDWSTKLMIRRNKGVYEPEFRILLVIPQLIFGCAGLYGFGITSNHVTHWILPDFFFALEVMGMVIGAVASALYIVDAHRTFIPHSFYIFLRLREDTLHRRYRCRSIYLPPCLQEHVQLWPHLERVRLVDQGRGSENVLCHFERANCYLLAEYSHVYVLPVFSPFFVFFLLAV